MDIQYWWLLALPLFFSLGWVAARIDIKQLISESRSLPVSYFKGLNFLMNEQPDKAIEAFLEIAKADVNTIELHFALGSLFRRRGETIRAIRMHQNLLDRIDLEDDQRLLALFELAQDYLKAGLLDRAEESFSKLTGTSHAEASYKFLLGIFEQEKDWKKAIATAQQLEQLTGQSYQKEIANFNCELASIEATRSKMESAKSYLKEALSAHRRCVRANILLGNLELSQGSGEKAIESWQKIEKQNPPHLALVAEKMLDTYKHIGKEEEGIKQIASYLEKYPCIEFLSVVFDWKLRREGEDAAYRLVLNELKKNPSLLGLEKLVEARLFSAPIEKRQDLDLIKTVVHRHTENLALYHCEACGFKARQFYWHCPACGGWETYPPCQSEKFETIL